MSDFDAFKVAGFLAAALLLGCGTNPDTPAFAGSWRETTPDAGAIEMSLLGRDSDVSGEGIAHDNPDRGFAVKGKIGPSPDEMTFNYLDGGTDTFTTIIANQDQLVLSGPLGTVTFSREE
ncbi:MAG TPA: hypothetical protein VH083_10065 [Myxococcales bacterium]|nr:hypothetical protein [Myxococcales bacterium]